MAEPNAVAILLATLHRDNQQIDDLRATVQHRQEQLAEAREMVTALERTRDTLGSILREKKEQLLRAVAILRLVAKAVHFYGWHDRQKFSDQGCIEAQIADQTRDLLALVQGNDADLSIASPGPHSVVRHRAGDDEPLLEGERLVLTQVAKAVTWDGALASKSARDSLFEKGLMIRVGGWNSLSAEGLKRAIAEGIIRG